MLSRYVPSNTEEHRDDTVNATWYTAERRAIGYSGNRTKHDFNYRFYSNDARDKYISDWLASLQERKARKAARAEVGNPFKAGDIFHHSWGYDQTQCDFYQVVNVTKSSVVIRQIESRGMEGSEGFMCENQTAVKDAFIESEPALVKRVCHSGSGYYLSMKYGWCQPWDGRPKYCSWYA